MDEGLYLTCLIHPSSFPTAVQRYGLPFYLPNIMLKIVRRGATRTPILHVLWRCDAHTDFAYPVACVPLRGTG